MNVMRDERQTRRLFALLRDGGVSERVNRLAIMSAIVARNITTSDDLTPIEVRAIIDTLDYWKRLRELPQRCRAIIDPAVPGPNLPEKETMLMMTDVRGHQLIQVEFEPDGTRFTYTWVGEGELAVGDRVQTPAPSWIPIREPEFGKPGTATVMVLGSAYKGTVTALTKRAER